MSSLKKEKEKRLRNRSCTAKIKLQKGRNFSFNLARDIVLARQVQDEVCDVTEVEDDGDI